MEIQDFDQPWDWGSPVRKLILFSRLPKYKLISLTWHKGNGYEPILHPETRDDNLLWLAIDLLIITFGNTVDYSILQNEQVAVSTLKFWKKWIATRPQTGFCEVTRPDKITDELAIYACSEILKSTFFREIFFPALKTEMYIAHHCDNFYGNLPVSPIEKSTIHIFQRNYLKNSGRPT